jgi:hypothetical protein
MKFAILLLAAVAVPSFAADPQAGAGGTNAAKEERRICKRFDASESRTGSKRICKTASQWRAEDDGDRGVGRPVQARGAN